MNGSRGPSQSAAHATYTKGLVVVNTPARAAIRGLGSIDAQPAELEQITAPELVAKCFELYGEPTRIRNKAYLIRRLNWRVQEIAEGGLSQIVMRAA